jgi:uncharacterized RDD family membrane protein YckC
MAGTATADDVGGVHAGPYAGVATRAVALAFDVVVAQALALLGFGTLAVIATLVANIDVDATEKYLAASGWGVTVAAYFVLFWSMTGRTPGMQLMRLRLADSTGRPPRLLRSVVRFVVLLLCIVPLFLGFVTVLFDARRRGLHDMAAGTVVLYAEPF